MIMMRIVFRQRKILSYLAVEWAATHWSVSYLNDVRSPSLARSSTEMMTLNPIGMTSILADVINRVRACISVVGYETITAAKSEIRNWYKDVSTLFLLPRFFPSFCHI
jgi:capsule polysaccharide modification protein KpsS